VKGIILAGGSGSRLHPLTVAISKQLMPVFDKPMIYYPLSVLMLSKIQEVLIISTPSDLPGFKRLLGDGRQLGITLSYAEQPSPDGLAQAFVIGRDFLAGDSACLILGDNLFYGHGFIDLIRPGVAITTGGMIFAYKVKDPQRYGVIEMNSQGFAVSLEEKPLKPKSSHAVPGLYFYGPEVCDEAARLKPSSRGEYEITDLNRIFLERGNLQVRRMGQGIAWLDTGTHESLLEAGQFVHAIQSRQGNMIACLEEIAWRNGWIGLPEIRQAVDAMGKSSYASYLGALLTEGKTH
jgi:glucose-1-phosphate thymidylyltransferase